MLDDYLLFCNNVCTSMLHLTVWNQIILFDNLFADVVVKFHICV